MKLWGKPILPNESIWTPTQLLDMIKEVDNICPEEGVLDLQTTNLRQDADNNGTNPK
jgi:hypothetical protein